MASDYRGQTSLPRGIRNNNPGNIKDDGTPWQGKVDSDGVFIIFADMSWGTRALAQALANMIRRGINTLTAIINHWAPSSDNNNVQAYINAVAADTGLDPNAPVPMDRATLQSITRAIINHENGPDASAQYVADADISEGIDKMNAPVLALFQAGLLAVQTNPAPAAGILLISAIVLYFLIRKK